MRQLLISVYPRPGIINKNGQQDNSYMFNSQDTYDDTIPFQFIAAMLNYSIVSSNITSTLYLSMNVPPTRDNVLRSGQPVEIIDNGDIVFQGIILSAKYEMLPVKQDGSGGGMYLNVTLAPSIYQLTSTPMIFQEAQATQIQTLLGLSLSVLAAGVTQEISSQALVNYMITNTDYAGFFGHTISPENLSDTLFIMAKVGEMRDSVLRSTIDFNNVVLFQSENGIINIRQLDSTVVAPFGVDLTNQFNEDVFDLSSTVVPMLDYEYTDNAAITPSVVSNYNMLSPEFSLAVGLPNVLSYQPSPQYYSRINSLAKTGWFTGHIGVTLIGDNIITNPTAAAAFNKYATAPNTYMISSGQLGAIDASTAAYQALLTGKQLAQSLSGYATLTGTISLDDQNLSIQNNMGAVIGTIIQIQNCDMESGIIATCNRSYSSGGSYLTFNVIPLGSVTGYWRA